jgi:uncharacterized protein YjbI with pentapeptide repeats
VIKPEAASGNAGSLCDLGATYYKSSSFNASAEAFEAVLRLEPENTKALYGLGNAYLRLWQFDKAVAVYTKVQELEKVQNSCPKPDAETLCNMGIAWLGKSCELSCRDECASIAEGFFKTALDSDQKNAIAKHGLILAAHPDRLITADQIQKECRNGRTNFNGVTVIGSLAGMDLKGINFTGADLSWVDFSGATLVDADFSHANLTYANFAGAILTGSKFVNACLKRAYLSGLDLSNIDFTRADLTCANLSGSNLIGANFSYSDLTSADLRYAKLKLAKFTHTCLAHACMPRLDLRWVDFAYADLSWADLIETNLTDTDFSHAYLENTNLTGSIFTEKTFANANISGAIGLGPAGKAPATLKENVRQLLRGTKKA